MSVFQVHFWLAAAWTLVAVSTWFNQSSKLFEAKTFQPLVELWIFVVIAPIYFGISYYGIYTKDKSAADLRDAIFASCLFPAAGGFLFLTMIGVETKGSVLDAIVDGKSGGSTQFLLENRVNLLALSLFLDLKIVNHGLDDLSKDLLRFAEGAIAFASFSVALSNLPATDIFQELTTAFTSYFLLSFCGLFYRRLVTDWMHPSGGSAAAPEAAEAAKPAAAVKAAKPSTAAKGTKATAKATPKRGKQSAKKAAPAAVHSFSSDEEEFDEDEAIKLEAEVVPKSLRYDSPGRRASLSIFVEGKRRRKSPARFVAKN